MFNTGENVGLAEWIIDDIFSLLPFGFDKVDEPVGGRIVGGHGVGVAQLGLDSFGQLLAQFHSEITIVKYFKLRNCVFCGFLKILSSYRFF